MELIALGTCGAYPIVDMGTSCYLIKSDVNLVFDFGVTALSRLERFCKIEDINGIFISHFHSDHINDIFTLRFHDYFKSGKKMSIYMLADEGWECAMLSSFDCFNVINIEVGTVIKIGETRIEAVSSLHVGKAVGFVVCKSDKTIYYTADTKLTESVQFFAKKADLLVCDCFRDTLTMTANTPHMSAFDVNYLAKICKGVTLATHLYPTRREAIQAELQGVEIIEELKTYFV